jgi:hypothetical protein
MKYKLFRMSCVFALFAGCLAQASRAQQETPPVQNPDTDNPPKQDAPTNPPQAPLPADGTPDSTSSAPPIRAMNGAGPLPSGRVSEVQLGPVYLKSADFTQSFEAISATGQTGTLWEYYSMLRADIVLDETFKNSHFAVQYQPRLIVLNGNVNADTANLNAGWTTALHLSPRLTTSFTNNLSYYSREGQFDNLDLMADITTGSLVQSNFLAGDGHFLNDRTEIDFAYLIGPRSRLSVAPYFEYYESSGTQAVGQSEGYGLNASYGYLLSPHRSVSLQYQVEDTHFAEFIPTTLYQTVSGTYTQQLSATWRISVGGGITTSSSTALSSTSTPQTGSSTEWTESGLFSLIKSFAHSTLAFSYYRGQALSLQITNGFADRYDLSYIRHFSRRTEMDLGAGYYREFQSSTDTSGIYSSAGLAYWLGDKWALETRYAYKKQQNGGLNYATGNLQYLSIGIVWEPARRPGGS